MSNLRGEAARTAVKCDGRSVDPATDSAGAAVAGTGWGCAAPALLMLALLPTAVAATPFGDGFEPLDLPEIPLTEEPTSARQTARPLGSTAAAQGYFEYLPPGYEEGGQSYPLLVFVHGLGENGDGQGQLPRVLNHGPPKLIDRDEWDASRPFVVLSPQRSGGGCTGASQIRDFIDYALASYRINPARIYLTGLSCGAIGSWNYASENLDTQIAAMVPIAGNGNDAFNTAGCALGRLPIWAFHGDADGTVDVGGTTGPVNNLLTCTDPPPRDLRMVIYPGVGHDSWSRTYSLSAGHDIYAWLLGHRRD